MGVPDKVSFVSDLLTYLRTLPFLGENWSGDQFSERSYSEAIGPIRPLVVDRGSDRVFC